MSMKGPEFTLQKLSLQGGSLDHLRAVFERTGPMVRDVSQKTPAGRAQVESLQGVVTASKDVSALEMSLSAADASMIATLAVADALAQPSDRISPCRTLVAAINEQIDYTGLGVFLETWLEEIATDAEMFRAFPDFMIAARREMLKRGLTLAV